MYRKLFELNRLFPLKVYLMLIGLSFITNILVQPYQLALQGISYNSEMLRSLLGSVFLNTVIYSAFAGLGLFLATRLGLGLPFLEKVIKRQTSTTVVALEVGVVLHRVDVPTCLVFITLGVPTDRAAEVVEIRLDPLEFLKA